MHYKYSLAGYNQTDNINTFVTNPSALPDLLTNRPGCGTHYPAGEPQRPNGSCRQSLPTPQPPLGAAENLQVPKKKWNLDEDGSDEDEPKKAADQPPPEEDEVDPLDAFMQVSRRVRVKLAGRKS